MQREIVLPPNLSGFLKSFREIGYSLQTAVADIVDNSISARATHIDVAALPSQKMLCVFDDGEGMDEETLKEALRLGTEKEKRTAHDLGKFGLGLKTASFSQTLKLVVFSKRNGKVSGISWDLDMMRARNEWVAIRENIEEYTDVLKNMSPDCLEKMDSLPSWTLVLWNKIDRHQFEDGITLLREHLALVFHRYLSDEGFKRRHIAMTFNGAGIEAFDPFAFKNRARQGGVADMHTVWGKTISITPYVLPQFNHLSRHGYETLGMRDGFTKNQGFYLYREGRLLCHGTWFNLAKITDASALARVSIDIDNKQDDLWNIDVKKSTANPVSAIKEILKPYCNFTKTQSKHTQTHKTPRHDTGTSWWTKEYLDGGLIRFRINREHPILVIVSDALGEKKALLGKLLASIENSTPVEDIRIAFVDDPKSMVQEDRFDAEAVRIFAQELKNAGKAKELAQKILFADNDIAQHEEKVCEILEEIFYD